MLFDKVIQNRLAVQRTAGRTSRSVSAAKAVSWRIVGTLDTMVISWLVTGKLTLALTIGGMEVISKMVLYYLHERAWERGMARRQRNTAVND
ncbi:MAG: DUF2061 domain-containing protein [Flavobacteriales bacterium]